jgi:hypothetical protein
MKRGGEDILVKTSRLILYCIVRTLRRKRHSSANVKRWLATNALPHSSSSRKMLVHFLSRARGDKESTDAPDHERRAHPGIALEMRDYE